MQVAAHLDKLGNLAAVAGVNKLIVFLVLLIVLLQYRLWFGDGNILEFRRLNLHIEELRREGDKRRERNAALEAEVMDLKQGLDAIEERARQDLGMVKEGEIFVQVIDAHHPAITSAPHPAAESAPVEVRPHRSRSRRRSRPAREQPPAAEPVAPAEETEALQRPEPAEVSEPSTGAVPDELGGASQAPEPAESTEPTGPAEAPTGMDDE